MKVDQIKFDGRNVTLYSGKVEVYLGQKDFYDDDMAALASVLKKTRKKDLAGTINMENFTSGDRIILKTAGDTPADGTSDASDSQDADAQPTDQPDDGQTEGDSVEQ